MNLLFDSQALVLWSAGKHFRPYVRRIVERPATKLFVSVVTPWELALKSGLRKVGIDSDKLWDTITRLDTNVLPVRKDHVEMHARLPLHRQHRDPFDRMLVAQALVENLTIVGGDVRFGLYRDLKILW